MAEIPTADWTRSTTPPTASNATGSRAAAEDRGLPRRGRAGPAPCPARGAAPRRARIAPTRGRGPGPEEYSRRFPRTRRVGPGRFGSRARPGRRRGPRTRPDDRDRRGRRPRRSQRGPDPRHPCPLLRRLRDPGGARPRRHGRRLQGPADQPQPPGRAQDDPGAAAGLRGRAPPVPQRGRGRRQARPSRTSCRSTRSASTRASATSRMKLIDGGSLAGSLPATATTPGPPRG